MTRVHYFDHQFASVHEIKVPSPALMRLKHHSWLGLVFLFLAIMWGGAHG